MKKIFFSYKSDDRELASKIVKRVRGFGHEVFFDADSMRFGQGWNVLMRNSIQRSNMFIQLLTVNTRSTRWLEEELRLAQKYQLEILSLRFVKTFQSSLPSMILNQPFVDFSGNYEVAVNQLRAALKE